MASSNYQKIGKYTITPLFFGGQAFRRAIENYAKYSRLNFFEDLLLYLQTGYVICTPTVFAMFKPIDRDGKRGWFVQYATGDLLELLQFRPCPLEFIAFCRNDNDDCRIISWEYFVKKVLATKGINVSKGLQTS